MLNAFLVGFVGGVGASALALRVLPVKLSFSWGKKNSKWDSIKQKAAVLHPNYCAKCKTTPCEDPFNHEWDEYQND